MLPADLNDGLKRLKMAAMRRLAPELLVTAKTQRWSPEEFLRTLVEAEIAARDASNAATRRRQAGFPVTKTLDDYDLTASSVPRPRSTTSPRLEWVRAAENLCLIGPAGTGKSHLLLALGSAAVDAGHRVRYLTAADLVDTLYRGLADNSVGKVIDTLLRNDLIICRRARIRTAGRHRRPAAVPVRRRRLRTPQPRHRLPLALGCPQSLFNAPPCAPADRSSRCTLVLQQPSGRARPTTGSKPQITTQMMRSPPAR